MLSLKKIIPLFLPLIIAFYYIYPQALGIRGSSFVLLSGVIGLALYIYHGFPFKEIINLFAGLGIMYFWAYTCGWMNGVGDPYTFGYVKTQIAYIFSSYLVIFLIFRFHKSPTYNTMLLYIAAVIFLQAIITFIMNRNEAVMDFLGALQMQELYTEEIMEEGASQRLMGYGISFFGAGAVSGVGLVTLSYLLMRMKLDNKSFIALVVMYVFTFYIGLFMARTTVVGLGMGLMLIAVLFLWDRRSVKSQAKTFVIASGFLMVGGYIFAMFYFPHFSDWAFELFRNFVDTGTLNTHSSAGLEQMFLLPEDLHTWVWGKGQMVFWGSDVGYSRMLFWVGLPGTIIFYGYQLYIIKLSLTKDWGVNMFGLTILIYTLALNIKGWIDLTQILYLIFFYFLFYKYYVYYPQSYAKARENLLVQRRRSKINRAKNK
ncbi:MAG: hypothetical protein E6767_12885 [Dysgonomonas sp.]|nr:hypothetical protein [Dysgonomonas sp.]